MSWHAKAINIVKVWGLTPGLVPTFVYIYADKSAASKHDLIEVKSELIEVRKDTKDLKEDVAQLRVSGEEKTEHVKDCSKRCQESMELFQQSAQRHGLRFQGIDFVAKPPNQPRKHSN